ncbi:TIGR02678 family protein [Haliangium sp.]|uniref:TIGR02678 family protein n=1 Tax=Haliangium sp. TaxID=2663208 RepID=UPI003D09C5DB
MITPLASKLETLQRAERTAALRHLLRVPLVCERDDGDTFAKIVRHRHWLVKWFAEQPSWRLVVEPQAGFARLYKVPARPDCTRPAKRADKQPPFDRRRYALLCLTLAALEERGAQTTLGRLAELVVSLSESDPGLDRLDTAVYGERRAFVDVLKWLVATGVLRLRDGDTEGYARSGEGDALYDIDDRLLGQILAAPRPPALSEGPEMLLDEHYPETDEGARLRARHTVLRRLLDDPVVYYDDLPSEAHAWLQHSLGFVNRLLTEDVGFEIERRREGIAAIDPAGEVSDTRFPDGGSTVKHAALLLAEQLAEAFRRGREIMGDSEVAGRTAALMADYGERCGWSQQYRSGGAQGARLLATDAMQLLAAFGLAERRPDGWHPRPAIARFAPTIAGGPHARPR